METKVLKAGKEQVTQQWAWSSSTEMEETQEDSPEGPKTSELALGNHCNMTTEQTNEMWQGNASMTKTKGIPLTPAEIIVREGEENLSSLQRDEEKGMLKTSPVHQTTTSPRNIQGHR